MKLVIGHATTLRSLRKELPPVVLLLGPRSIGKWTIVQHLADHHQIPPTDRAVYPDGLSMDTARKAIAFVSRAPHGTYRLVQARLDNCRTDVFNALLKTLEEPPETARFLLTASVPLPPTVISRAHVHLLGLLSNDDVRDILIEQGVPAPTASRAAALGRGQVQRAIASLTTSDRAHDQVCEILRAIATGDRAMFYDRAFTGFDETSRTMLTIWLHEASTGQWAVFTPQDSRGLHTNRVRLRAMVLAVSQATTNAPRLGVRAALEAFLPRN